MALYLSNDNNSLLDNITLWPPNVNTDNITTKIVLSDLRKNSTYVLLYKGFANFIVTGILPLILLAYFNFRIYKGMLIFARRLPSRNLVVIQLETNYTHTRIKNERTQSIILFAIVIIFLMCHILRIALNLEDWIYHEARIKEREKGCKYGTRYWALLASPISEILLEMNSSVIFFIYCFFNKSFRNVINTKCLKSPDYATIVSATLTTSDSVHRAI